MNATDIVGYTYQSDTYCPRCIQQLALPHISAVRPHESVEWDLGIWAEIAGVNRNDESTFDSSEFPNVIFADSGRDLACLTCHAALVR